MPAKPRILPRALARAGGASAIGVRPPHRLSTAAPSSWQTSGRPGSILPCWRRLDRCRPGFACGIANVQIEGIDTADLNRFLWDEHRILAVSIKHDEFEGLRVSPSVYTTLEEIDRFAEVMEGVVREGLPAA
jgi:hypothetical protein